MLFVIFFYFFDTTEGKTISGSLLLFVPIDMLEIGLVVHEKVVLDLAIL